MSSLGIGDMTVYPGHGVAEVMAIEPRDIGGIEQSFYALRVLHNGMDILVPTNNVRGVGLRETVTKAQLDQALKIFSDHTPSVTSPVWNQRHRSYVEKLSTGAILEVASVLRDLSLVRARKEISFGERRLLDTARALFINEMAVATNQDAADVEMQIDALLPIPLLHAHPPSEGDVGDLDEKTAA